MPAQVDNNTVASFKGQPFEHLRYLQWLSIIMNLVTELDGLIAPSLETLNLTGWPVRKSDVLITLLSLGSFF